MPTANFNLPLIDPAAPISIVNDLNSLATATDSAMGTLATAGDVASVRTVATNASQVANGASTAAEEAKAAADAANVAAVAAQSTATSANATANTAQQTAVDGLAAANRANAYAKTVINANNYNSNGVLNLSSNIIGTQSTDGFFVYEFSTFFFIEFRGVTIPHGSYNINLGTFVPYQKIDSSLSYVAFAGLGFEGNALQSQLAIERTGVNSISLVGYCAASDGSGRRSGWVVLPKAL